MAQKNNIDKYQGYPHYPANEDITRAANNNGKRSLDAGGKQPVPFNDTTDDRDDETAIVPGTEADLTAEDLQILEATEQNLDTPDGANLAGATLDALDNDGDPLNEGGGVATDLSGSDLDVPGSEDDDANEDIGEEDEENNFYSLGGDLHEAQEEAKE